MFIQFLNGIDSKSQNEKPTTNDAERDGQSTGDDERDSPKLWRQRLTPRSLPGKTGCKTVPGDDCGQADLGGEVESVTIEA
jgi:hypothetical protein